MDTKKHKYTDEERLKLAAALDSELDTFINALPQRKPDDDVATIDEILSHPFFMQSAPGPNDPIHPLYEGLQQLKYDPDTNTPYELASAYKDDGNFNYKHRNYRMAIISYTEGIKVQCDDVNLQASLLNNRAAALYELENYRSCLRDCDLALQLQSTHLKCLKRATNAAQHLKQFTRALHYVDQLIRYDTANDTEWSELRLKLIQQNKTVERDKRKREMIRKQCIDDNLKLLKLIRDQQLRFEDNTKVLTVEYLQPHFPQLTNHPVHFDPNNHLVWPVVFLYPESMYVDYIEEFHEQQTFKNILTLLLLDQSPEWDAARKYRIETVNLYFKEHEKAHKIHDVEEAKLKDILQDKRYTIKMGGTPEFFVVPKDSLVETNFLLNKI